MISLQNLNVDDRNASVLALACTLPFPPFLSRFVVPIRASVCLYALSTNNLSQLRNGNFFRKLARKKFIFGVRRQKDFVMPEKIRVHMKEATKRNYVIL
jgi:hypothetical protein